MALKQQIIKEAQKKCAESKAPFISTRSYGFGGQYMDSFLSFALFPFKIPYVFLKLAQDKDVGQRRGGHGEIGMTVRILPFLPVFLKSQFDLGQKDYFAGNKPKTQKRSETPNNFLVTVAAGIFAAGGAIAIAYFAGISIGILAVLISGTLAAITAVGAYTARKDYYNSGYDDAYRQAEEIGDRLCFDKVKDVCIVMQKKDIKDFSQLYDLVNKCEETIVLDQADKRLLQKFVVDEAVGDLIYRASNKTNFIASKSESNRVEKQFYAAAKKISNPKLKEDVQEYIKEYSFGDIREMFNSERFTHKFLDKIVDELKDVELSSAFRDQNANNAEKSAEQNTGQSMGPV